MALESDNEPRVMLNQIFKSWHNEIKEIIKLTPDSSIGRIEVYDHDPIEIWFKNRVVLLGDSAHAAGPTSGQGACQAIEDAYCLAECLSNESTVEQSLETYTFLRKDKASNIIIEAKNVRKGIGL